MKMIAGPPEADMMAVANGDFSGLSLPILVACRDEEQLVEFVFSNGLMCSPVVRFRTAILAQGCPEGKVLLLLPGWEDDRKTKAATDEWIFVEDRYTCQLRSPRPLTVRPGLKVSTAALAAVWVVGALVWVAWATGCLF